MIRVTMFIQKDPEPESEAFSDTPASWRVQSCTIDLETNVDPLTISSDWVYASPIAAQQDMQQRAWQHIRLHGYTGSKDDIEWQCHVI